MARLKKNQEGKPCGQTLENLVVFQFIKNMKWHWVHGFDGILSLENAELETGLKLSRAEIQTLLSKFSISYSKVDTLTYCQSSILIGISCAKIW